MMSAPRFAVFALVACLFAAPVSAKGFEVIDQTFTVDLFNTHPDFFSASGDFLFQRPDGLGGLETAVLSYVLNAFTFPPDGNFVTYYSGVLYLFLDNEPFPFLDLVMREGKGLHNPGGSGQDVFTFEPFTFTEDVRQALGMPNGGRTVLPPTMNFSLYGIPDRPGFNRLAIVVPEPALLALLSLGLAALARRRAA